MLDESVWQEFDDILSHRIRVTLETCGFPVLSLCTMQMEGPNRQLIWGVGGENGVCSGPLVTC